jgi:hypothetical protein
VPVDPGPHVVSVRAPGKRPWETTVEVLPDGKVAHVEVPALADAAPSAATAPAPAPAPAPTPATELAPKETPRARRMGATAPMPPSYDTPVVDDRGGGQRAIGWFFVGAGVAAVGVSSYFWARWVDDRNAPIASTQHADAPNQSRLGEAVAGGGAAAIVLGAIVVATAPSPRIVQRGEARLRVSPWLGAERGGFIVGGSF